MSTSDSKTATQRMESTVRRLVEELVEAKIAEYKKLMRAFLLGLGLFFGILVSTEFLSQSSLLVYLHDKKFGSDRGLSDALKMSVALSYSNEFVLTQDTSGPQYLTFYANKAQRVKTKIEVNHRGPGSRNRLLIGLGTNPVSIWQGNNDVELERDLTETIWPPSSSSPSPGQISSPGDNLHHLTIQVDPHHSNPRDRIYVKVLLNVIGLEREQ